MSAKKVDRDTKDTRDEDVLITLPRDKNGKVLHAGDVIVLRCIGFNSYEKVISLDLREDGWVVRTGSGTRPDDGVWRPDRVEIVQGHK